MNEILHDIEKEYEKFSGKKPKQVLVSIHNMQIAIGAYTDEFVHWMAAKLVEARNEINGR